jgi:hypothetical protein
MRLIGLILITVWLSGCGAWQAYGRWSTKTFAPESARLYEQQQQQKGQR